MRKIVKCAICGNEFVARQKNSRTCSARCYQRLQYQEDRKMLDGTQRNMRDKHRSKKPKKEESKIETMAACKHRDCIYRGRTGGEVSCDFCVDTGKPRGCKISECDKYIPGKRRKQQLAIFSKTKMSDEDKGRIEANAFRDQQYRSHNK